MQVIRDLFPTLMAQLAGSQTVLPNYGRPLNRAQRRAEERRMRLWAKRQRKIEARRKEAKARRLA